MPDRSGIGIARQSQSLAVEQAIIFSRISLEPRFVYCAVIVCISLHVLQFTAFPDFMQILSKIVNLKAEYGQRTARLEFLHHPLVVGSNRVLNLADLLVIQIDRSKVILIRRACAVCHK